MRNRKSRMFKYRSNGRNFRRQVGGDSLRVVPGHFSNPKNNFKQNQSAEKLLERYKILAKEASSSGDKILSENYFQHADHFARIFEEKNLNNKENQINNEVSKSEKVKTEEDISNSQDSTAEKK